MLRQLKWRLQNGPITKSSAKLTKMWSFGSNYLIFFGKFVSVLEPLQKSSFDAPTTQMPIFVFFVTAGV